MTKAANAEKKTKRVLKLKVRVLKNKIATCRGDADCMDGIPLHSAAVANF